MNKVTWSTVMNLNIYDIKESESEYAEIRHIRFKKYDKCLVTTAGDFEWLKYLRFRNKFKICKNLLFEGKRYTPEQIGLDRRFL